MATSGSYTGLMTAEQMVQAAGEELGYVAAGEQLTGDDLNLGIRQLNWMLKSMTARGVNLWREDQISVPISAGSASVTLDPSVENVMAGGIVIGQGFVRELFRYERSQFGMPFGVGSQGVPTGYYPDIQRDVVVLYVWPIPAADTTIYLDVALRIQDVTLPDQTVDVPQKWTEAIYCGLAARLAGPFGVTRTDPATAARVEQRAAAFEQLLLMQDQPSSYYMGDYNSGGMIPRFVLKAPIATPTPTPTPTPVATFTAQPTITGTPQVGSVAAFSAGAIANGTVGTIRLRKDGADYSDGSALSFQWTATGSYVLRVTIAGTSIYADSAAVTVTTAPVAAVPAPSIALATTNADGSAYTAGTNPPRVVLTIPQTLDKTAYRALLYYDQASSGAVATDTAHTLTIEDLMAAGDAEAATFSAFGTLAAGNFRAQAVFQNKSDSSFSPLSMVLTTTLNAKVQAAATTTFDPTNKSQYAVVSSDYRSFTGNPSDGRFASAAFSATRSDARYWEMTVTAVDASTNGSDYTGGGITSVGDKMPTAGVPTSNIAYAGNSGYPVGTVYSFEAIPATSGNNGTFKVWINGSLQSTQNHSLTSYLPYALCYRDDTLKLNAGQEAFAYTNLSTAQRYN